MKASRARYQQDTIYFLVLFADADLRVPIIRTLQFIGSDHRRDGTTALLFRELDPQGKAEKMAFGEAEAPDVVLTGKELLARLEQCFAGTLATSRPA
jgi:hypothetical protein